MLVNRTCMDFESKTVPSCHPYDMSPHSLKDKLSLTEYLNSSRGCVYVHARGKAWCHEQEQNIPLDSVIPATTEPCSGMGRHFSTSKLTGFFD